MEEYLTVEEIARRVDVDLNIVKKYIDKYPDSFTSRQEGQNTLYSVKSIEIIKQIDAENNAPWWQKVFKNFRSCSGD